MNILVLAGARIEEDECLAGTGTYRAGLVVGGKSLLEQALSTFSGLSDLGKVVLVGPEKLVPQSCRELLTEIIEPGTEMLENLEKGLGVLPQEEPVLVAASDLPLLTQAAVADFLSSCVKRQAELYYPVIRRETYESAFPGSVRTYLRLRDGVFTGGNMVLFSPASVYDRHRELLAKAVADRKRPHRLARFFGPGFFLGLLLRRYTVAQIESRVNSRFGLRAVAVESRFSEMGYDVDSREDLDWIEFYWGGSLSGVIRKGQIGGDTDG